MVIPGVGNRSYSICSSDIGGHNFKILVGRVAEGSATDFFFEKAKVGTLLTVKGPFGSFFYRKNGSKNLVFCATGSGISPIISIMNSNDFKNDLKHVESIHLYWSNATDIEIFELCFDHCHFEKIKIKRFVTRF